MGRRNGGGKTKYALYRGDEYVATGTAFELAELLGVRQETIYFYASAVNRRRNVTGNRIVAERI